MRTETINASDGRTIRLVVPPLPGQCWEALRIQSATARSGAALGLLLAAGAIETPQDGGKVGKWRPPALQSHRGSMEDWGYTVFNAVKAHTGWGVALVSGLADAALVLVMGETISGEEVDRAAGFFSAPFLETKSAEE
jgi:hypothetical protein